MLPPIIEVNDLSFAYGNQPALLNGCNLNIKHAERWHLYGENGSGKSTLFHLLLRLIPWQSGTYCVEGTAVSSNKDHLWLRHKIGLLTQDAKNHLFCPTIGDDCRFGPLNHGCSFTIAEERTQHYLSELGMIDYINSPAAQLSGGQIQRAALAAILCCENILLLLDEPSTGLDKRASEYVINALNNYTGSIIITSHDEAFGNRINCNKCSLNHGQIKFSDLKQLP